MAEQLTLNELVEFVHNMDIEHIEGREDNDSFSSLKAQYKDLILCAYVRESEMTDGLIMLPATEPACMSRSGVGSFPVTVALRLDNQPYRTMLFEKGYHVSATLNGSNVAYYTWYCYRPVSDPAEADEFFKKWHPDPGDERVKDIYEILLAKYRTLQIMSPKEEALYRARRLLHEVRQK